MQNEQTPAAGTDNELIERSLRTIHAYDAVRYLRDALSATTARLTGYDWNADPEAITRQQGDAFAAADKVFADLNAAVDAHPDIDLPECASCGGTGKIEEAARTEGANQHSACVRRCDECDGCGFAPADPEEDRPHVASPASSSSVVQGDASGVERSPGQVAYEGWAQGLPGCEWSNQTATQKRAWEKAAQAVSALRPQPSGETREAVARLEKDVATVKSFSANIATFYGGPDKRYIGDVAADIETVLALIRPAPVASSDQPDQPEQGGGMEGESVEDLWRELCERDDRTSPAEYPEMCLITFDEFSDFINRAEPAEARVRKALEAGHEAFLIGIKWQDRATAAEAQLARMRSALERIDDMRPATCETSLAHDMAQIASEALAALQEAGEVG